MIPFLSQTAKIFACYQYMHLAEVSDLIEAERVVRCFLKF